MPHAIVEYSANLEDSADIMRLLGAVRQGILDTGLFSTGGTRVRAARREHYIITDGAPENAFCHITLRIGPGRANAALEGASHKIFHAAEEYLSGVFERGAFCLSLEFVTVTQLTSRVHNTMKDMPCAFKKLT